jgi:hypothetical protein
MHHVTGVRIVRAMMPSSQGTADMAARPAVGTAVLQEAAMARPEAVRLHGRAASRRPRAASDKPPALVREGKRHGCGKNRAGGWRRELQRPWHAWCRHN